MTQIDVHSPVLKSFRSYLQAHERGSKTVETYVGIVQRTLKNMNIDDLSEVTPIDLAEWRRVRFTEAKPATINLEINALRQFFRFAKSIGAVSIDPTERIRHAPEEGGLAPKWLNRNEQHRLIRTVQQAKQVANTGRRKKLADRNGALVALMLHAGLRVSEACSLKVTDVKISERKGAVVIRQGKGSKRREVPLNRNARDALQSWLLSRDSQTDWLFPGVGGKCLTSRAAQAAIERLGKKAGLEVSAHQLRHTFCHELVQRGVPLDQVALLAGHTTASGLPRVQTTVRYTLPDRGDLEAAVTAIEWE